MQVPETVRERMRKAGSGAAARKEGVAIAREMLALSARPGRRSVRHASARALRARARGRGRIPGSGMRARTRRLGGGIGLVLLAACRPHPSADAVSVAAEAGDAPDEGARPNVAPLLAPARCRPDQMAFAIQDGGAVDDLAIGDAISSGDGETVAVVRRTAAGRVAGVVLVPRDGGASRVVDLEPTLGDAPHRDWHRESRTSWRRSTRYPALAPGQVPRESSGSIRSRPTRSWLRSGPSRRSATTLSPLTSRGAKITGWSCGTRSRPPRVASCE